MDNSEFEKLKQALENVDSTGQKKDNAVETDATIDINSSSGTYEIDLSSIYTGNNNITLGPSALNYGSVTLNGGGSSSSTILGGAGLNYSYTTGAGVLGSQWSTANINSGAKIELEGDDSDILINGRSLCDFMEKMEKRLAILVPDPNKLEQFESLQKAYNHYKTLEALCELTKPDEET